MTREERLQAIADALPDNKTILVYVIHQGSWDGAYGYMLYRPAGEKEGGVLEMSHRWNVRAYRLRNKFNEYSVRQAYKKFVVEGR
jgi:hypothetical protein